MATSLEPLPRKFPHEISTRDTIALSRRFTRWVGARRQDLPAVTSFSVNPIRSEVSFSPGESYSMDTVRAIAAWAVDMQAILRIELSGYMVSASIRVDDGERSTTGDDNHPDVFDLTVEAHINSGIGRLVAWMVRDHEHTTAEGTHVCPHCGHNSDGGLGLVPEGGVFECDPAVLCIAWDNAYAEYRKSPTAGTYVNADKAFLAGTRAAILGALFYNTHTARKAEKGRRAVSAE